MKPSIHTLKIGPMDYRAEDGTYIVEASDHGLQAYPALLLILFPDGSQGLSTMLRVVRSDSGQDVGAIVYEVDGKEVLHIIND